MTKVTLMILSLLLLFGCSSVQKRHERYYQKEFCSNLDGTMEYILTDRTRVDCLTDTYAIEVDFAKKWAESIGQSLFYAKMTDRAPAVAIIVDSKKDQRYLKRLNLIAKEYDIRVFMIEKE